MQIFTLDADIDPSDVEGELVKVRQHEFVKGAYRYEFAINKKVLFLTAVSGKLQEITYDCSALLPWHKTRKRQQLLAHYDDDHSWVEVFNNKVGCMLQNPQETRYATWEYKGSTISFGVMLFREEMQRAVN